MNTPRSPHRFIPILLFASFMPCGPRCPAKDVAAAPLEQNAAFTLDGRTLTLTKLDTLPFVESDYTKRFKFDSSSNPKLKALRERYKLDEVIAPGKDEFERQVLLLDWTHRQFKKFGRPSTNAKGALEILKAIDEGHSFFCAQYAEVLVSSAASLGWVNRPLALRRHQGVNKSGGSTEHSVTEIWSNQHRKWVMLDPTANMHLEKNNVPLNAYEIRQEWFYHDGTDLVFVVGSEHRKYRKSDLPIKLEHFDGFGDLSVDPDELDKYGFIGFIPNTDLMDAGYDYGKMFIVKDALCDGTQWHTRTVPANPATDPYFPIGQAAMSLTLEGGRLNVALRTLTPNFKQFEVRTGSGEWKASAEKFEWKLQSGANRLEARTVNASGVTGPASVAEIGEILLSDNFTAAPAAPWKWVRENAAGWRTGENGLEVRVEPGNMWGPPNDARNLLLRPAPDAAGGELEITVTVSNQPDSQYEQSDLVWYYDDSHMVKIGQEMVDGKLSIVMGREEKDRTRTIAILPLTTATVKLRLLVRGETIHGQYQPDGAAEWKDAGTCTVPKPENGKPHLCLQFYQGAKDAPHWSRVTAFTVRRLP